LGQGLEDKLVLRLTILFGTKQNETKLLLRGTFEMAEIFFLALETKLKILML